MNYRSLWNHYNYCLHYLRILFLPLQDGVKYHAIRFIPVLSDRLS